MKSHDSKSMTIAPARQFWRAFVYVLQVHENRIVKRAGVAGVRARATRFDLKPCRIFLRSITWKVGGEGTPKNASHASI